MKERKKMNIKLLDIKWDELFVDTHILLCVCHGISFVAHYIMYIGTLWYRYKYIKRFNIYTHIRSSIHSDLLLLLLLPLLCCFCWCWYCAATYVCLETFTEGKYSSTNRALHSHSIQYTQCAQPWIKEKKNTVTYEKKMCLIKWC